MTIQPTTASFLVTEDCNLNCTYCFEKHLKNKMTNEVAEAGLELLANGAVANGSGEFHAMIFGGEPLLEPGLIRYIFDYGLKLASEMNLRFTASIVTNATLMNDKIENLITDYIDKVQLTVQLSVDGIKEVQDMYRVTRDDSGSFDTVAKNVPVWKELFSNNMNQLSIHGCINKKTMPYLTDNYLLFRKTWDIPRVWFMPIHTEEWDDDDVASYKRQLMEIANYTLYLAMEDGNYNEIQNYSPIDKCLSGDCRPDKPCGAGSNFVTITASGDIYPCHHFYFNDPNRETKIGNVFDGIDDTRRQIFLNYGNEDMSCPSDCEATHCYRCIAENYQINGSILSQIQGKRCGLSLVEREVQLYVRGKLKDMGLLKKDNYEVGNNPNNPACLCDMGGSQEQCKCRHFEEPKKCKCDEDDSTDVIASALSHLIDKVGKIEENQNYIIKLMEIITKKLL